MLMKILGWIWTVIVNLVTVAIVLGMFSRASTGFETIMVAGLVLLYTIMASQLRMLAGSILVMENASATRFATLAGLLKDPNAREYHENAREQGNRLERANVRFFITGFFLFIIWIIAVFNLVGAL